MCVLICMFVICIHVWIRLTRRHEKQKGRNTAVIHNQASLRPSIRQRNIYMSYMYVIYIYIYMYRYIYICIIIYMIYTQPHSNIPDVHHFKVQFETKCQSIRHFSSFSWIPESHDIPRYPSLQLPISEWCAPNNLGPESGGSWSNAKLSENWAPMEFVTVSPVEKGCWWSFYWKNIMRNIYIL